MCDTTSTNFTLINDQSFCVMEETKESQEIRLIKSDFQGYDIKTIFQENVKNEKIINFKLDHAELKMIILSEVKFMGEDS